MPDLLFFNGRHVPHGDLERARREHADAVAAAGGAALGVSGSKIAPGAGSTSTGETQRPAPARPATDLGRRRLRLACYECDALRLAIGAACCHADPAACCNCGDRIDAASAAFAARADDPAGCCPNPNGDRWAGV